MTTDNPSFAMARAYGHSAPDIVERFAPMVRKLAWHLQGMAKSGIDAEDLVQAGLVALTECASRHEGSDPQSFAAYAKIRVKGAMIDQLRRFAPLSRGASARRREVAKAENDLWCKLGREPEEAEVAQAMRMQPAELAAMRSASMPVQFDSMEEAYSDSDLAFSDQAPGALDSLIAEENREELTAAIAALPERLQLVIQLYFVEELNLAEIAAVLGLSVPRIHQLKDQALQKIRGTMVGSEC